MSGNIPVSESCILPGGDSEKAEHTHGGTGGLLVFRVVVIGAARQESLGLDHQAIDCPFIPLYFTFLFQVLIGHAGGLGLFRGCLGTNSGAAGDVDAGNRSWLLYTAQYLAHRHRFRPS